SERINALILAKEANDMHVREVCTENAILATKLKELQLHLFTMSDELLLNALLLNKFSSYTTYYAPPHGSKSTSWTSYNHDQWSEPHSRSVQDGLGKFEKAVINS
ncbi:hypothetical protein Tco_1528535, partial [Tanacetum coccineum]